MKDRKSRDDQKINLAKSFINEAKKDLECSRKIKYPSRKINYLQQSIEKASKAFYIIFVNEKSISKIKKKIGHFSPLVFTEIMENDIMKKVIEILEFQFSLCDASIKKYDKLEIKEKIKDKKYMKKLRNISEEEISLIFSFLDMLKKQKSTFKKFLLSDFEFSIYGTTLFVLAFLTYPHYNSSRYPEENTIEPEDYDNNNIPIVKFLKKLYKETKECIKYLEKIVR